MPLQRGSAEQVGQYVNIQSGATEQIYWAEEGDMGANSNWLMKYSRDSAPRLYIAVDIAKDELGGGQSPHIQSFQGF